MEQRKREVNADIQRKILDCQRQLAQLQTAQQVIDKRLEHYAKTYGAKRSILLPIAKSKLAVGRAEVVVISTISGLTVIQTTLTTATSMDIISKSLSNVGALLTQMNGTMSMPRLQKMLMNTSRQQHLMQARNDMMDQTLSDMNAEAMQELDEDVQSQGGEDTEADRIVNAVLDRQLLQAQHAVAVPSRTVGGTGATLTPLPSSVVQQESKRN